MSNRRKGSRLITVRGIEFAWYRGKTVTEIKRLHDGKKIIVPNPELEVAVEAHDYCECCGASFEELYGYPPRVEMVTLPGRVAKRIHRDGLDRA